MPPKPNPALKRLVTALKEADSVCQDDEKWSLNGDYVGQAEKLSKALAALEAIQAPFNVVDGDLPWSYRAERLLAWLRTHKDFSCKKIELVDNLPAERGSRGIIAKEDIAEKDAVLRIPGACMLSTATAIRTPELGPIIQQPGSQLADLPTITLTVHLMVEHARCLQATASAAAADAASAKGGSGASASAPGEIVIPVPVEELKPLPASTRRHGKMAGGHGHSHGGGGHGHSHGSDGECSSPHAHGDHHDEEECGDDSHGHSHGGGGHGHARGASSSGAASGGAGSGGHGHSHGGKPCHGHGHGGHDAPAPAPAPAPAGHGHSHGGKPCHGHGHGGASTGSEKVPIVPLDSGSHPWGSAFRAYISLLPSIPGSCLYFTQAQLTSLAGFEVQYTICKFMRDTAMTYLRLYNLFGLAGMGLISGFQEHFTWAHFRWAISCAMSRQNRVPIAVDDNFAIALIPLYDMVNSMPGPITSFFFGDEQALILDAGQPFPAGSEVLMSYGDRSCHQMLQFQGYVPLSARGSADTAIVDASMTGLDTDPLFKIRVSILSSLFVTPEHNAQRYLRTPEVQKQLAQAEAVKNLASQTGNTAALPLASLAFERIKWGQPFSFQIAADGTPSVDLLTFLRVAAMSTKGEAAEALKQCDAVRKAMIAKREEAERKTKERIMRNLAKRTARRDAAAAKSAAAGGGGASGGAGADEEDSDDDEEEEEEEEDSFTMALSRLSTDNEVNAQEILVNVLRYSLSLTEGDDGASASASAGGKGGKGKGATTAAAGGAGGGSSASASGGYDAAAAYKALQTSILKAALAKAEAAHAAAVAAAAAEGSSTAAAGGGGGAASGTAGGAKA